MKKVSAFNTDLASDKDTTSLDAVLKKAQACTLCAEHLPQQPKPILQASINSKLLIVGQAPGIRAHNSGVPWDDASGERLREWLGLSDLEFYDQESVAILPMGFCYPGKGERGDLPPRKECYQTWHQELLQRLPNLRLTLLVGSYAQNIYLKGEKESSLTKTVKSWKSYLPHYLPLPHPSPLNNIWLHKNKWFQEELPLIKKTVQKSLAAN